MKKLALFLSLALLLSGCVVIVQPADTATPKDTVPFTTTPVQTTVPTTTAPPETTAPVTTALPETTVPIATSPVITDFTEYEALLTPQGEERNWLFFATGCVFEKPQDLDLCVLFYTGLEQGSWESISEESAKFLVDNGFWRDMDIQVMHAGSLDAVLEFNFGVLLEDVTIPSEWRYLEKEDVYCSNHNDVMVPCTPTITAVTDDGTTIVIHYTVDFFYNSRTQEYLDKTDLVMTLERSGNELILCRSNVIAP